MKKLSDIFEFVKLLRNFSGVKRVIFTKDKRWENDSEHSYQLAMLAWYIVESRNLKLNSGLALKYALVHDLVEVYAGDTYLYTKNRKLRDGKKDRERKAALTLKKEFPRFKNLYSLINSYENLKDRESRFVYALDKVIPMINIYLGKGDIWKLKNISLKMLIDNKKGKVSLSPAIEKIFDEFVDYLAKNNSKYFGGRGKK